MFDIARKASGFAFFDIYFFKGFMDSIFLFNKFNLFEEQQYF